MNPPSEQATRLADATPFSAWEIQEVFDAVGEHQGIDLIHTAEAVGMRNLASTAWAMKNIFAARGVRPESPPTASDR